MLLLNKVFHDVMTIDDLANYLMLTKSILYELYQSAVPLGWKEERR